MTDRGEVVGEHRIATPRGSAVIDAVIDVARNLANDMSPTAIGVGLPGLVDRRGVLRFAANIRGAAELDIAGALRSAFPNLAVAVENDATCAGWGEREVGAGAGRDHVVLITLGTGIGAGIIADGKLFRGANGFAGEVGHMIVDPEGPRCPCGQRGCWERYASGSGLGQLGKLAARDGAAPRVLELAGGDAEAVRGEHVSAAAMEGDAQGLAVMAKYGWWVALGLANLANAFDPEVFVLGGGLVEAADVLLKPVRDAFAQLVEASEHRPEIQIVPATLGERAGAIGAALLARDAAAGTAP